MMEIENGAIFTINNTNENVNKSNEQDLKELKVQILFDPLENTKNSFLVAGANTCKTGEVLKKDINEKFDKKRNDIGLSIFSNLLARHGSIFHSIEKFSKKYNKNSVLQEFCLNFIGIGDKDGVGIRVDSDIIREFTKDTGIAYDALPINVVTRHVSRSGIELTGRIHTLIKNHESDNDYHKINSEKNIIKNVASVLLNNIKNQGELEKFIDEVEKNHKDLKAIDLFEFPAEEIDKIKNSRKADDIKSLNFQQHQTKTYKEVLEIYKKHFKKQDDVIIFDECCRVIFTSAVFDESVEFAENFSNPFKDKMSADLLFQSNNKEVENIKERLNGEPVISLRDFQRLHYIQCVFYSIMISAIDEKPEVRKEIFQNIQNVIADFEQENLPESYGKDLTEENFIKMMVGKIWTDAVNNENRLKEINKNIKALYNLVRNPASPEHVTQVNILQIPKIKDKNSEYEIAQGLKVKKNHLVIDGKNKVLNFLTSAIPTLKIAEIIFGTKTVNRVEVLNLDELEKEGSVSLWNSFIPPERTLDTLIKCIGKKHYVLNLDGLNKFVDVLNLVGLGKNVKADIWCCLPHDKRTLDNLIKFLGKKDEGIPNLEGLGKEYQLDLWKKLADDEKTFANLTKFVGVNEDGTLNLGELSSDVKCSIFVSISGLKKEEKTFDNLKKIFGVNKDGTLKLGKLSVSTRCDLFSACSKEKERTFDNLKKILGVNKDGTLKYVKNASDGCKFSLFKKLNEADRTLDNLIKIFGESKTIEIDEEDEDKKKSGIPNLEGLSKKYIESLLSFLTNESKDDIDKIRKRYLTESKEKKKLKKKNISDLNSTNDNNGSNPLRRKIQREKRIDDIL